MLDEDPLDFGRIDVLATGDDQVVLTVVDEEIAVAVACADVAAIVPTVAQCLSGRRLVTPIFAKHVGSTDQHLPGGSGGHFATAVVNDACLAHETRQTG